MTELIVHASGYMIEPMVQEEKVRQTFSRRLALACDRAGMESHGRQADIAAALGVTPKAVSKWFNAESIPRRGKISELAEYVGAQSNWLLGEGSEDQTPHIEARYNTRGNFYRVEVLDAEASAGNGRIVSSDVDMTVNSIVYDNDKALEIFGHRPADTIKVITVVGDSMSGTIETGDYIFIDVAKDYFDGDGIYVFSFKGALLVKRLQFTADGLLVRSDNSKYADWLITDNNEQHLKIVGRVIYSHGISRYV
ncbi:S24 family peptidase [Brenneria populi subsp. brevivirga]|uniref:XRE family transcriptional regulator n=1 Tax=Brenneria populi TaxID=1505588 RepID=UPI002E17D78B|nr:S24 family peptidase [Brenneria populi subsp. brevivirga]